MIFQPTDPCIQKLQFYKVKNNPSSLLIRDGYNWLALVVIRAFFIQISRTIRRLVYQMYYLNFRPS